MLWIPYYGYGSNDNATINSIGYVANKTNIFDYVLLQSHYYFQESADYAARYDVYAKRFSNQAISGIPARTGYNKASIDFAFYCDGPFTGTAFTSMQSKLNSFYA